MGRDWLYTSCGRILPLEVIYPPRMSLQEVRTCFQRTRGNARSRLRCAAGVIVATASITEMHSYHSYAEYNGTKAAVLNFLRGSAGMLKIKDNARLNCVLSGIVKTAIVPPQ